MLAIRNADAEMVDILLASKADAQASNFNGQRPIDLAQNQCNNNTNLGENTEQQQQQPGASGMSQQATASKLKIESILVTHQASAEKVSMRSHLKHYVHVVGARFVYLILLVIIVVAARWMVENTDYNEDIDWNYRVVLKQVTSIFTNAAIALVYWSKTRLFLPAVFLYFIITASLSDDQDYNMPIFVAYGLGLFGILAVACGPRRKSGRLQHITRVIGEACCIFLVWSALLFCVLALAQQTMPQKNAGDADSTDTSD